MKEMEKQPTRSEAYALLCEYNKQESLIRHGLAVEAVMCHFAEKSGENIEKWSVIGLCHDLDYEQFPDQHCTMTRKILEAQNWPEDYIRAIVSHGWGICSDTEPIHYLEKVLFAIDELTGLITASVYVRPSKSILDLTTKSVMKKWNTRSFAAGANRDVITKGADMLGIKVEELVEETILAMQKKAETIGLKGIL
ncbi:MAG TPA: HD domain-containing protein [Prolixibacteraceae bacterium]|nr:HD domain-containing protein [Prolixibacteraceae bacterium]